MFFIFAEHELEEKSNLHFSQIANSGYPVKIFSILSILQQKGYILLHFYNIFVIF